MSNKIYPCLWFDDNAREAAGYYCSVFENTMITAENPIVVTFTIGDKKIMCLNGGPRYKINPSVSFFANFDTAEAINAAWEKLSDGGMVMMPLNNYPWSERYGWCQDKFGVNWQLMLGNTMEHEKIVPSMMFTQTNNGRAQEAIDWYTGIFPGSSIKTISRYAAGEGDVEGHIKHAQFTLSGYLFTVMESSGAHAFTFTEGVSFVVECEDQAEIDHYWNALTEGGEESMCGWLKDKFGLSWQIVPKVLGQLMSDPERSQRVIKSFLQMRKFDIEKLVNA